jgi:hypothetical protein
LIRYTGGLLRYTGSTCTVALLGCTIMRSSARRNRSRARRPHCQVRQGSLGGGHGGSLGGPVGRGTSSSDSSGSKLSGNPGNLGGVFRGAQPRGGIFVGNGPTRAVLNWSRACSSCWRDWFLCTESLERCFSILTRSPAPRGFVRT